MATNNDLMKKYMKNLGYQPNAINGYDIPNYYTQAKRQDTNNISSLSTNKYDVNSPMGIAEQNKSMANQQFFDKYRSQYLEAQQQKEQRMAEQSLFKEQNQKYMSEQLRMTGLNNTGMSETSYNNLLNTYIRNLTGIERDTQNIMNENQSEFRNKYLENMQKFGDLEYQNAIDRENEELSMFEEQMNSAESSEDVDKLLQIYAKNSKISSEERMYTVEQYKKALDKYKAERKAVARFDAEAMRETYPNDYNALINSGVKEKDIANGIDVKDGLTINSLEGLTSLERKKGNYLTYINLINDKISDGTLKNGDIIRSTPSDLESITAKVYYVYYDGVLYKTNKKNNLKLDSVSDKVSRIRK